MTGLDLILLIAHQSACEVRDGPKKEEDGTGTGQCTHEVDGAGNGFRTIAEQDNKKTTQQGEQRCTRWVGEFKFRGTGYKFTAVPQTASGLTGQVVCYQGDGKYDPAGEVIRFFECHTLYGLEFYIGLGRRQVHKNNGLG